MDYGTVPTGFARKRLPAALAEIEEAARGVFGSGVVQTAQSPLGQLNGLLADIVAKAWEIAEDTYQSYDPDQAEGIRLEQLGRIRLLDRVTDEADADYRQAITNAGRARIDLADLTRAVQALSGVTYAQVFINDGDSADSNGIAGHSVAVAALGGDDAEIATTIREYVVPGIGTSGNRRVDTTIDGFCRSIWLVRPTVIPITLSLNVRVSNDRLGCPPPAPAAIAIGLAQDLMNPRRLLNGDDVTAFALRSTLETRYPNVEYVSGQAARGDDPLAPVPLAIGFFEIASFSSEDVTIVPVA